MIKNVFVFLQIKATHPMMRLSYGTFDPAAQSCPLFFLQIAGLPEARACLSGRAWFFAAFSRLAPACPGDRMMQGAFLLERSQP